MKANHTSTTTTPVEAAGVQALNNSTAAPKTASQKRRAALAAQAQLGQAQKGTFSGKAVNGLASNKESIGEQHNTIGIQDSTKKSLRDSIGASGQAHSIIGGRDGGRPSISMDHDHEEHSTHEDRKTSTSSDAQLSEPVGYASVSINELDHHNALGKQSPLVAMECKSLFANGAVGGSASTAAYSNLEKNIQMRNIEGQLHEEQNGGISGAQTLSQQILGNVNQAVSSASSTQGANSQQLHPFNVLISDFQQKRQNINACNGNNSMRKQSSVFEFYGLLQKQIRDLESQYAVYKKQRRQEQLLNNGSSSQSHNFSNYLGGSETLLQETQAAAILMEERQQLSINNDQLKNDCGASISALKVSVTKTIVENDENSSELANNGGGNKEHANFFGGSYNPAVQQPVQHFEPFSSFDFQPNLLQFFYPKQVQRQLHKKKYSHSERIIHGLKPPTQVKFQNGVSKHALKLRALSDCQMSLMKVILQRIDRKSRPIRKQEKQVHENLRRRRVNLDDDNPFDILQLIQSSYSNKASQIQLNAQSFLPMGQLSEYKNHEFQEPCLISSSTKTTQQLKVIFESNVLQQSQSSAHKLKHENPEDQLENELPEVPKLLDKRSASKIENSSSKKPVKIQAIKILGQVEGGQTEAGIEKVEITPKTNRAIQQEEFKIAAKKVTSKTASKLNEGCEMSTPSQVMKKLSLKKSQSVVPTLSNNDDTPMKDEQLVPKIQLTSTNLDLNLMVNDLDITPLTPNDGGNKTSKKAKKKYDIQQKSYTLPKEHENLHNETKICSTFDNEKEGHSFKIKIPGVSIQLPNAPLGPQNLQKSKSYTPTTKQPQKNRKIGGANQKLGKFEEVGEENALQEQPLLAHSMQFDQEDQIQNLNLPLENYEEDCMCECMLQQQQQHAQHSHKYHQNQGLPLQQLNPLPNSTSYFMPYSEVDDNGVCQACCNSGDDVLHVNEHPKFVQSSNHGNILQPVGSSFYHHSVIHSQDPSPRNELRTLGGTLHRQYSVPANQLHMHHHHHVEQQMGHSLLPQEDDHNQNEGPHNSLYFDAFISQNGFKSSLNNNYSQPRTAPSTNLNSGIRGPNNEDQHMGVDIPVKNHCVRTIDFYGYDALDHDDVTAHNQGGFNPNMLGQSQSYHFNDFNNSGLDGLGTHRGGILGDLPSVGKEMHKMHPPNFFHHNDSGMGGIQSTHRMTGLGGTGNGQNNSPDPQGTTTNRHFNHPMMLIDSATPMFTSEFTIMPAPSMMVGGIDTALGAPHLIHEWNPLNDTGILQPQTTHLQQVGSNTSSDHLLRHESSFY